MPSIEGRVSALEKMVGHRRPSAEDQERSIEALFASYGLTREQAIKQYGSVPAFVYHDLWNGPGDVSTEAVSAEIYIDMLG